MLATHKGSFAYAAVTPSATSDRFPKAVRIAFKSSDCLKGLKRQVEMPIVWQRSTSPRGPPELSIMIVAPAQLGSALIDCATSNPSMPGIW